MRSKGFSHRLHRARGFTLIEVLVVLVVVGIVLAMATLSISANTQRRLNADVERLALLMSLAREEALLRNRVLALEMNTQSYRFLVRNQGKWVPLSVDEGFGEVSFSVSPVKVVVSPWPTEAAPLSAGGKLYFEPEMVTSDFAMQISAEDGSSAKLLADGLGHYWIER